MNISKQEYLNLIRNAHELGYALPAINVSDSNTAIAAFEGLEAAGSPGIIQITIGSAKTFSRTGDPVEGAALFGRFLHELNKQYDVPVALHTDHCHYQYVDTWLRPLLHRLIENNEGQIFNSFMFDGSMTDIKTNAKTINELLPLVNQLDAVFEVEAGGAWGGAEDGVGDTARLSTPADVKVIADVFADHGISPDGFLLAVAFGNAHGTAVKADLKPELLADIANANAQDYRYVFHGGSGSSDADIHEAIRNGVVKMNVDTDLQYDYSQGLAGFIEDNESIIHDHKLGKKAFDPRKSSAAARASMITGVDRVCSVLMSKGRNVHKPYDLSSNGTL
jgi:fructose-bisphosphate aldolase class II